jgi:hypothetical protein
MQIHPDAEVAPSIRCIYVGDVTSPDKIGLNWAELPIQQIPRNGLNSRGLESFKALASLGIQSFFLHDSCHAFATDPKTLSS